MIVALFFYLFAGICVASAFMVIAARNPVHSVLYLILAFVNAAGLFVMMGAEFLAMILIVVYVGAVAVLFLFVVMMIDVDFSELKQGVLQYLPIGMLIGGIFVGELLFVALTWVIGPGIPQAITAPIPIKIPPTMSGPDCTSGQFPVGGPAAVPSLAIARFSDVCVLNESVFMLVMCPSLELDM